MVWANGVKNSGLVSFGIVFTICTNHFPVPKKGRQSLKLVSVGFNKWYTNFRLEHFVRKTELPGQMFHLLFNRILPKLFR